jgi:hypothetical protein
MTNQLALKSENALADIPMDIADIEKDARLGGDLGMRDIAIPYLYILQLNSPQVNPDNDKYIEGASAGKFLLTVRDKVFEGRVNGVTVVPCYYERKIMEWIDRDKGGGLVGSYPAEDPIMKQAKQNERGQWILPNGHMLIDTAYHYVLVQDPETMSWTQAIMPMKSTALKISRKLNSVVATAVIPGTTKMAPRFLYKYNLTTVKEQKDTNVWSSPYFLQDSMVTKEIYDRTKAYAQIAAQNLLQRSPEAVEHVNEDSVPF